MSVDLVRPSVKNLIFEVYARPLHPELFDILATRRIQREDYQLTVHITRTGHVITWDSEEVCLSEVASSSDQQLPEKRRLLHYRLRGEHTGKIDCVDNICYQMSFQVETMQPEIFLHAHDEILADGQKRGLLHNFRPNHRLSVAPLSLISAEAKPGCLLLSTFHTFPSENAVVKSQTLIEKKR
jgi:hypothetical protein